MVSGALAADITGRALTSPIFWQLTLLLLFLAKLARRQVEIRFFPLITMPALAWLIVSSFSLLAARDVNLP